MLLRSRFHHIRRSVRESRLKVVVASTSELALPTIEEILRAKHEILGLITKADRPAGRGRKERPQEIVSAVADKFPIFKVSNQGDLEEVLHKLAPELVIAISFGMLVKLDSLQIPSFGWINLHFSLLPRYRGAAPVQRAILAGDDDSGVTVFALDEGMDTGPIYVRTPCSIANLDSGAALTKLASIGANSVVKALAMIEKGISPTKQESNFSLAPKINPEELRINFHQSPYHILNQIRAFSPTPGAWCQFRGNRIKILEASVQGQDGKNDSPGAVLSVEPLKIASSGGFLEIKKLQESGKKVSTSADWVRGARIKDGEKFE